MRYYHYGSMSDSKPEVKKMETFADDTVQTENIDGLIIDEDTVYEIDEECIKCRKNKFTIQP